MTDPPQLAIAASAPGVAEAGPRREGASGQEEVAGAADAGLLDGQPGFTAESVSSFPGEQPSLLGQAFDLAAKEAGLSVAQLAHELAWTSKKVRDLLGVQEQRPVLRLVQ